MYNSKSFFKLTNSIQNYPWGSNTSIPELFNIQNPDDKPFAEIWMGAHPKASSEINIDQNALLLRDFITENIHSSLGEPTATQFGELPYLFKVLSAKQALSIQVHPSKKDAKLGFDRENQAKLHIDAFERNYKDANHKPELVYALTPFLAMNGFRLFEDIAQQFRKVNIEELKNELSAFEESKNDRGLCSLFTQLLSLEGERKELVLIELLQWSKNNDDKLAKIILELNEVYPNDVGLLAPLFLNVILLAPGEAMFLDAGTPHAYLKGTALEIMANSDNVLRAGLTPKYIDVTELVSSCLFVPLKKENILTQAVINNCEYSFPIPVDDFAFSIYKCPKNHTVNMDRAEILFAIDADVTVTDTNNQCITIGKGESIFIPFSTNSYSITSRGDIARAY
ncbi:mannose-6-phosphate isomerase [Vibrio renipiscarius]|uniref:mannose-6-phosphate isomerase n=2 Tax=Vibrio renipiscarius TaxID=1461322 RepID=A0A0C2NRE1_9VIBR|nr:mannose-6-phosphate isomerase, class I [Vibrio renipiscarius]KII75303.1 mannose-6-phosphate isomerase [Vibrio renipiscarius]KII78755.1 mannose-6-phosphate isomerase [Vibrio renipiscarius]